MIIEASGVADPAKIANTGDVDLALDGILVVVDAEQIREQAIDGMWAIRSSAAALTEPTSSCSTR